MRMTIALPSLLAAALMAGAVAAQPHAGSHPAHGRDYQVQAEVVGPDDRQSLHGTVKAPGQTEIGDPASDPYVMTVSVTPVPSQADQLVVEATISRVTDGEAEVISTPRLIMKVDGTAQLHVGSEPGEMIRMSVSPAG